MKSRNRITLGVLSLIAVFSMALPALATRAVLTPALPPNLNSPVTAGAADMALTGAASSTGYQYTSTGRELIFVYNSDTTVHTVTIHSVADPYGRSGDITSYSLSSGDHAVFGPFPLTGWKQSDGNVYIDSSSDLVKFSIITLP